MRISFKEFMIRQVAEIEKFAQETHKSMTDAAFDWIKKNSKSFRAQFEVV